MGLWRWVEGVDECPQQLCSAEDLGRKDSGFLFRYTHPFPPSNIRIGVNKKTPIISFKVVTESPLPKASSKSVLHDIRIPPILRVSPVSGLN